MALTTGRKNGFVNLPFANISQLLKKLKSKYWAKMVNATFEYKKTGGVNY